MSLKPSIIEPVPAHTVQVARAAFPKGNLYLSMRDELGTVFKDTDFMTLFSRLGYPAVTPKRLPLITIMQFLENLSDRQAAEAGALAHRLEVSARLGADRCRLRSFGVKRISLTTGCRRETDTTIGTPA